MRRMLMTSLFLVSGIVAGYWIGRADRLCDTTGHIGASTHTGLTIQQIQPLSALMTTRIDVADVQETTVSGYTGSIKVAILVKGDLLLGVDLSKAHFENLDLTARTAELILPEPIMTSPRVDHTRTRIFAFSSSGLWQLIPGAERQPQLLNHAFEESQRMVATASRDPALIERAKVHARCVLEAFLNALGWNVRIRWCNP